MGKKITVGILRGGKSAEHEVSCRSAENIFNAIDKTKYNPVLITIDASGAWQLPDSSFLDLAHPGGQREVDVVFPVLHGPFGEDGTVQGLLKLAGVPFVGAGVLGSAAGMDKDVMKRLLRDAGIPVAAFLAFKAHEDVPPFEAVAARLGTPVFVKPANMGSSVGVHKVSNGDEYLRAVRDAFLYDTKIVLEEFVDGREFECSVLGNERPEASVPGEVAASRDFYSYEAKYLDKDGARIEIPANIPVETAQTIRALAVKTFTTLECEGLSRVDFFLRKDSAVLVNEINTMPGFTDISMYPKLWEASGISYAKLIDTLIELAFSRHERDKALKTSYTG
jgi:D-alanine-D-alanine ligase